MIYLSTAVAGGARDACARICGHARVRNARRGIGGVLLYDGHHFAQWLCGPDEAVSALMQRIAADPRHDDVQVLLDAPRPAELPVPLWRAGYTAPEVLPAFAWRAEAPGADALQEFQLLLPAADLWPPLPQG